MLALPRLQNCLEYVHTLMIPRVLADATWAARLPPDPPGDADAGELRIERV